MVTERGGILLDVDGGGRRLIGYHMVREFVRYSRRSKGPHTAQAARRLARRNQPRQMTAAERAARNRIDEANGYGIAHLTRRSR